VADPEQTELIWRKSPRSTTGNCVEVAFAGESVLVRNSRDPLGPVLSFSRHEWAAFLEGASNGDFTLGPSQAIDDSA
jgi:hypothetical protein